MNTPLQMQTGRTVKPREMNFLLQELSVWQENSIVTQEQAERIAGLYTVRKRSLVRILLCAGAALVVLGGISLVAANWPDIPRVVRLVMILTGYIACVITAWGCETRGFTAAARAFLLLAAFVYGAGIFLVAHMYNYHAHWSTGVGWWIAGLFPTVLLIRDTIQLSLVQILSLVYLFGQDILKDFFYRGGSDLINLLPPAHIAALLVMLWLAYILVHGYVTLAANVLLTLFVLASRMLLCFSVSTTFITLSLIGLALSLSATLAQTSSPSVAQTLWDLRAIGLILSELCGLPLIFEEIWVESVLTKFLSQTTLSVIATVILGGVLLWRFHRGRVISGLCFVLVLCRWFFDDLLSFMSRAVGFTTVGAILLAIGIALEWRRRKKQS